MFPEMPYVNYIDLNQYEVTFYILKPRRIRTQEVVKASSSSNAKLIIKEQYGEVQIVSVKPVKK
jgi:hypothetical protein